MSRILTLENVFGNSHTTNLHSQINLTRTIRGVRYLFNIKSLKVHYSFVFFENVAAIDFKRDVYISRGELAHCKKEMEEVQKNLAILKKRKPSLRNEQVVEDTLLQEARLQEHIDKYQQALEEVECINKRVK